MTPLERYLAGATTVSVVAAQTELAARWRDCAGWTGLGACTADDLEAELAGGRAHQLTVDLVVDQLEGLVRLRRPRYREVSMPGRQLALVSDPTGMWKNYPDRELPRGWRSRAAAEAWTFIDEDCARRLAQGYSLDRLATCWGVGRSTLFSRQRALNRPSDVQRPSKASDPAA